MRAGCPSTWLAWPKANCGAPLTHRQSPRSPGGACQINGMLHEFNDDCGTTRLHRQQDSPPGNSLRYMTLIRKFRESAAGPEIRFGRGYILVRCAQCRALPCYYSGRNHRFRGSWHQTGPSVSLAWPRPIRWLTKLPNAACLSLVLSIPEFFQCVIASDLNVPADAPQEGQRRPCRSLHWPSLPWRRAAERPGRRTPSPRPRPYRPGPFPRRRWHDCRWPRHSGQRPRRRGIQPRLRQRRGSCCIPRRRV